MIAHVIVADDHSMIRKGIKLLIMSKLGYRDVEEADSCNALMNLLKKGTFTHIILDVVFPDGSSLELVPVIKKLYPGIRIMIFSMQPYSIYADVFKHYGVNDYLLKSSTEEETANFIQHFLSDESPERPTGATPAENPFSSLSPRELEILHYLLNGYKTSEIATELNLGNSTVSTMKMRIMQKTNSPSMTHLYELAAANHLGLNIAPGRLRE